MNNLPSSYTNPLDVYVKQGAIAMTNRTWSVGDKMVVSWTDASTNASVAIKWLWECTTGGTSNGTPTWPASVTQDVTTVTQNGVVWTARMYGYSSGTTRSWAYAAPSIYYAKESQEIDDYITEFEVNPTLNFLVSNNYALTNSDTLPGTFCPENQDRWASTDDFDAVLSVSDSAIPATTLAACSGSGLDNNNVGWGGGGFDAWDNNTYPLGYGVGTPTYTNSYCYGVKTKGSGVYVCGVMENCTFLRPSNPYYSFDSMVALAGKAVLEDCVIKNESVSDPPSYYFNIVEDAFAETDYANSSARGVTIRRLSVASGCSGAGSIVNTTTHGRSSVLFEDCDFSNCTTAMNYLATIASAGFPTGFTGQNVTFKNCKLPPNWTGNLTGTSSYSPKGDTMAALYNCTVGTTKIGLWLEKSGGRIVSDTGIYRTDGAVDGTTPFSWKMEAGTAADMGEPA